MAISEIGVHTGRMNQDIKALWQGLAQARSHIQQLSHKMDTLNRMWEGATNEAMRQRFQRDYENMQELCNFLQQLIQELETACAAYDACENNVSGIIGALSIS